MMVLISNTNACRADVLMNFSMKDYNTRLTRAATTTFVCSLNPIRQTSILYTPPLHHIFYYPFTIVLRNHLNTYPFRNAHTPGTRLLNESVEKQRLSPEKRRSQSEPVLFAQTLA